jgi:small subunit ribosomal protein S15e
MADAAAAALLAKQVENKKRRTFKKFSYRGIDLDNLLEMSTEQFTNMTNSRHRRSLRRGLKKKHANLIAKLNKEKIAVEGTLERPKPVKTHLRDIMILPQMVGNIIGIYNGKQMLGVEVKAEMVGTYTGEYGITYKPVRHGRPGIGSTHSSRFIPLK